MTGLFGEDFNIKVKEISVKELIKKAAPKKSEELNAEKVLKSKKLTLQERVAIINERVTKVLGKQKQNIVVIRDRVVFDKYIADAIASGYIAVDTETNNSLDPVTCKLMGLCLYYPGGKQAYIPINHVDIDTKELLPNQLTTDDCREELQKVLDAKTFVIMHNGKFDYEVIKCTCGIEIPPDWDTIIAARLLNENEFSDKQTSLKYIYTKYIDPSQEKYDIEGLFENIAYAVISPDIFALYAATDSLMTYKIYLWQVPQMEAAKKAEEELGLSFGLYGVFKHIEMPIVKVTGDMELEGVCVDQEFGARLKEKYNGLLTNIDDRINVWLNRAKPLIKAWWDTDSAKAAAKMWEPKKTKKTREEIETTYPIKDPVTGRRFKHGKALRDQLEDPINLASSTQLAILFFDVLGAAPYTKPGSRSTGKEDLEAIEENSLPGFVEAKNYVNIEETRTESEIKESMSEIDYSVYQDKLKITVAHMLCSLILERRGISKLITTYIDVIPDLVNHWPDKRIRFHLNSMGTDTGRYSSGGKLKFMENDQQVVVSGINIQNIPSRGDGGECRLLFKARYDETEIEETDNYFEVPEISEVETTDGWKFPKGLAIGDALITNSGYCTIINIIKSGRVYKIITDNKFYSAGI